MKNFTNQLKIILLSFVFLLSINNYAQSIATYDISLTTIWNATDHTSIPGNAHWSDLIGATHNTADEFVSLGTNATLGIQNVAESGSNGDITSEINAAITAGKADQLLQDSFSPFAAISSASFTDVSVSESFPLITLVSMVAPSPDWLIAINSLNLRNAGNTDWKDTFTMDVFAYDAGTDDGSDYTSSNSPISPVGVFMITGFPINGNKMATITFTLKNVLSVNEVSSINKVKMYPNPSKGNIIISNTINSDLETIEIYNILGSLVKQIHIENRTNIDINLNLNDLNKGVYLTKLIANNGKSKTQKLLIE